MSLQSKSNNVSLKFKISDTLRHKLKVNYKGVTESIESIVLLVVLIDGFNCFMNKASPIFRLKAER